MKNKNALLLLATLLLLPLASVKAADLVLCNEGAVTAAAATASLNPAGFFNLVRKWKVSGWYEVKPGQCETVFSESDAEPIYVALAFTDFTGRWGAFSSEHKDSSDDDVFHDTDLKMCVVDDEFQYTTRGSDLDEPCKAGYFPFPATLYITPTASRSQSTFSFKIDKDNVVVPIGKRAVAGNSSGAPSGASSGESSGGMSTGTKVAIASGIAVALIIGKLILDPADSSSDSSSAPSPFEAGTLNATFFGDKIVRRKSGAGVWYLENGSRVDPAFQLDGQAQSDLLDAPAQRDVTDAEVAAAQESLKRALAGFSPNRHVEVRNTGRLVYSFEDENGLLHQAWTNLSALDFAQAHRLGAVGGITGVEIPCRNNRPCTIGRDKDKAGTLSDNHIYSSVILYFANNEDGGSVWQALVKLRSLYPAEPSVVSR